jgi:uncharacterized protein
MSDDHQPAPPVEVPPEALSEDALLGVIENFILREGTDYGLNEVSHETKVRQIRTQIEKGDVKIVFDPSTETVHLLTKKEWQLASSSLHATSGGTHP